MRVELFHLGPPKSATTWIYRCLREHPGVVTPPSDAIHYFSIHRHRDVAWYHEHFKGDDGKRFDPTPSYFHSPQAPGRIAAYNPDARLAVCLRHPIERAFSHYWHAKKKRNIRYTFDEVLKNHDLFMSWLEPGFHAEHLEQWFACFPREQVLCQRFEDLKHDPRRFLGALLRHYGVDDAFEPKVLKEKVNIAGHQQTPLNSALYAVQKTARLVGLNGVADRLSRSTGLSGRGEYVRGIDPALWRRLLEVCEPQFQRLEALLDIDLTEWRKPDPPTLDDR